MTQPLIKDEKIRKAVREWAELNNIKEVAYIITGGGLSVFTKNGVEIDFTFQVQGVQDGQHCTITELCGEGGRMKKRRITLSPNSAERRKMRQYRLKANLEYYNGKFTELDWVISELDKYICAACTRLDYEDAVWNLRGSLYKRRSQIAEKKSDLKHQLKEAK